MLFNMKLIKLLLVALIFPFITNAQEVLVREGNEKMGKTKLWCFSATYPYDKSITIDIMEKNIADANMKRSSRKKGFSIYRGVTWQTISNKKGDYYYKIRSKKGKTTVYLCASSGYDNYVTTKTDPETAGSIVRYFQKMDGQIKTAIAIKEKEKELLEISEKNAEIKKQLDKTKENEAQKTKEIENLKKQQAAPPAVK